MSIVRQFKKTGRSAASKTKTLCLKLIRVDGGTQSRAGIDDAVVEAYAEDIADGVTFPPTTVFYDGTEYWLADGFHRYRAHLRAKKAKISADIKQGTQRDAMLYSVGANATHGLRRTNEDKRRAVLTLLNDAEWVKWSDREIARRCAVGADMVGRLRPAHTVAERQYVHPKTGSLTTMDTSAIGGSLSDRSDNFAGVEKIEEAPDQDANLHLASQENDTASSQAEDHATFHQQAQESLPQAIRDMEAAKQQAIAARKSQQDHGGLSPEDRIAELEEAVRVLEAEAQQLRAENKKYGEMRVQFEEGGFEKVIAGKDEEIRVLMTRVEHESGEKVRNLNSMEWWKKKALEHGYSRNIEIDIETGAILNG